MARGSGFTAGIIRRASPRDLWMDLLNWHVTPRKRVMSATQRHEARGLLTPGKAAAAETTAGLTPKNRAAAIALTHSPDSLVIAGVDPGNP